ncbi:hypothetical protein ABIC83_002892 [Roseateles asaccharophilus]|uniref:hypothetical protein n=1 Tax=Roseateles asaccharophilus TaxID=582607 RepID=UPI0038357A8C
MSYKRVIPRDLFNEANLLKCYGRIYICLEPFAIPGVMLEHVGQTFDVEQDPSSGNLYVANIHLNVHGTRYRLERPLNSRESWSLFLTDAQGDEVELFDSHGDFTEELLDFIRKPASEHRPPTPAPRRPRP